LNFKSLNSAFIHSAWRMLLLLAAVGRSPQAVGAETSLPIASGTGDYLIQNWQADEGLPRNSITCLTQDHQGYLWMGTPQGLIRFDGVRFVTFESDASPAMARGSVQKMISDDSGAVWIATRRSGLFRYLDGSILSIAATNLPSNAGVDSLAQDRSGVVWLTRGIGTVGRLESGAFISTADLRNITKGQMLFQLTFDSDGNLWFCRQDTYGRLVDGKPTNWTTHAGSVITLAPSRNGGLWVSTGFDLRRLNSGPDSKEEPVVALPSGPYGLNTMFEDHAGTLWLGMSQGGGLYRLKGRHLEKVEEISHSVYAIFEDTEGDLWVGTDGAGLFKIRPRVFRLINKDDGLPTASVVSVCNDWVAPNSGGLGKMMTNGRVEMIPDFEQQPVSSILEDGTGGVWFGMKLGEVIHQSGAGASRSVQLYKNGPQVRVLHRDQKGNLWVGGFPAGLFKFPAGEDSRWQDLSWRGFTNQSITAIAEDHAGCVWIGTSAGNLYRFSGEDLKEYGPEQGFLRFPIGAMLPGTNDSLWVGTLGGGLGWLQHGKVQFLGKRADLGDDVITQLIQDKSGWMWVGSSRGISRVLTAELQAVLEGRQSNAKVLHFGPADGLANVECVAEHQPSVWMTPAGQIRFATSKGVVSFDPAAIPMNYRPPPLNLECVLVDDVPVSARTKIKLLHDYKKIEFRYTAMSFIAPEKVCFKRHLSGFDESWVEDGRSHSATYPRLAPGDYEFQFNACNNDGVWNNEPYRFTFQVVPAFWQTSWFHACALVAFAGLVGGGVLMAARVRMRRKLTRLELASALERERTRIAQDLHDDLGARTTKISVLAAAASRSVELPETSRQLHDVSQAAQQLIRALDETVWTVNPGNDSLANLLDYVTHYAEEFFHDTPVRCQLKIPVDVDDRPMSPDLRHSLLAIIKESLNNVLKHSGARNVVVAAKVEGRSLSFTIRDDGCGFSPGAQVGGNGLANLRARATAIGARIEIQSLPGQGTTLRVEVPELNVGFVFPNKAI